MRFIILGAVALLVSILPVLARSHHPRIHPHGVMHGEPITVGSNDVRVTPAGEVISMAPFVSVQELEATTVPKTPRQPMSSAVFK